MTTHLVRPLRLEDLEAVSRLCLEAFSASVAASLPEQGIATFQQLITPESFTRRMQEDNLMLVHENNGQLQGMIELKEGRHLAMLFVDPACQRQGVGRTLLLAALQQARVETITVKASLTSVGAYQRYGFELAGEVGEAAGLVYQPMELAWPRLVPADAE